MTAVLLPSLQIASAFRSFDQDGSGTIDASELEEILRGIDDNLGQEDIQNMMAEADVDGDGQINYAEFANMLIEK